MICEARRLPLALACAAILACPPPALALSEIQPEQEQGARQENPFPGDAVPMPPPVRFPTERVEPDLPEAGEDLEPPDESEAEADESAPEIMYDLSLLPEPVRRMHGLIVEACRSGDIERLRPLLGPGDDGPQLSFGGTPDDPIAFLKESSGDAEGHEILAILLEVLSAGFVHLDPGAESELYVWPYFFAVPLDRLTPPQRVELFTLVTGGDYQDMQAYGAYVFYRVGITPGGRWAFFVAGD